MRSGMGQRKPARTSVRHSADAPEVCQAAQIAMVIMKRLRVSNWEGVVERARVSDVREKVTLTAEQQELIDTHRNVLPYLQTSPTVTVVCCTVCGRFGFYDKRNPGKACLFTHRCPGVLVKAKSVEERESDAREGGATNA